MKKACIAKDDERAIALLALASNVPPPNGSFQIRGDIDGQARARPPTRPRRHRVASDDEEEDGDGGDDGLYANARVVVTWSAKERYPALLLWLGARTATIRFDDGELHNVHRSTLDLDDDQRPRDARLNVDEALSDASDASPALRRAPRAPAPRHQAPPRAPPRALPPPPPAPRALAEPCSICLSPIFDDEATVLSCEHAFHASCLRELSEHTRIAAPTRRSVVISCPLCRRVTRQDGV